MPSLRSSPWIRRAPHSGLARLMARINWRISSGTFGLPPGERDLHRQNKRKPARCQRITVSGLTITRAFRTFGEAGKNETIEIAKSEPLWRFSSQHNELMAQRHDLRLKRGS